MTSTDERFTATVDGQEFTLWELANLADCGSPDSLTSAGARFLFNVADATAEQVAVYRAEGTLEDDYDYSGELHEIADNAPDVYTHTLWSEFVDLAAYNEDASELGADASDMEKCARICLYMIADRLTRALVDAVGPFDSSE